jgi:hypothetical protein
MFIALSALSFIGIIFGIVILINDAFAGIITIAAFIFSIVMFRKLWLMEQAIIELQEKTKKQDKNEDGE